MTAPESVPQSNDTFTPLSSKSPTPMGLWAIWTESFRLLSPFFPLVYPVFFYFLFFSLVLSQFTMMEFSMAWVLLSIGLLALWFICLGGWHMAMAPTLSAWIKLFPEGLDTQPPPIQDSAPSDQTSDSAPMFNNPFEGPLTLLKRFVMGIGEQAGGFLIAGLLWYGIVIFVPSQVGVWWGLQRIGFPKHVMELAQDPTLTQQQLAQTLQELPKPEWLQLNQWMLLIFGLILLMTLLNSLFLYWPQFIALKALNPFKALGASVAFAWRHWFTSVLVSAGYVISMGLVLVLKNVAVFTSVLGDFLLMVSFIHLTLLLFLIILRKEPQHGIPEKTESVQASP